MKITKNYLIKIIKEELETMQEMITQSPEDPELINQLKTIATKVMNKIDLNDYETKLLGNIMSLSSKITRGIPTTRNEKEIVKMYLKFRSKVKHK